MNKNQPKYRNTNEQGVVEASGLEARSTQNVIHDFASRKCTTCYGKGLMTLVLSPAGKQEPWFLPAKRKTTYCNCVLRAYAKSQTQWAR